MGEGGGGHQKEGVTDSESLPYRPIAHWQVYIALPGTNGYNNSCVLRITVEGSTDSQFEIIFSTARGVTATLSSTTSGTVTKTRTATRTATKTATRTATQTATLSGTATKTRTATRTATTKATTILSRPPTQMASAVVHALAPGSVIGAEEAALQGSGDKQDAGSSWDSSLSSNDGTVSTGGIAAIAVIIGLVAAAVAVGAVWLLMRRQRVSARSYERVSKAAANLQIDDVEAPLPPVVA